MAKQKRVRPPPRSRRVVGQDGTTAVVFERDPVAPVGKTVWARMTERMHPPTARTVPVATVMTAPVTCVTCDLGVETVAALFLDEHIGALPVVDEEGQPIGILTKSDLMRSRIADARFPRTSILELMTPIVTTVHENESVARAAALMLEQRVHHLPVIDDERGVVGMVSTFDFARFLATGPGTP